ncbi:MAG: hypothetical protein LAO09_18905 [Acidobacteriia bacterium]|nr:hypothetical protein [Terriglobia bacterium]
MSVNRGRVFLGGLAGGVVWFVWGFVVNFFMLGEARYQAAQSAGLFLKQPRYPLFPVQWAVILLVSAIILAHLYAWARQTMGPGPGTAIKIGLLVGFIAGFPTNFAQASWSPVERIFPLAWMLEMWVGAILATLVAGWLYKE